MVREIVIFGDPVLRKKCSKVESFSEEVSSLVNDMIETMVSAEGNWLSCSSDRNSNSISCYRCFS